MALTPGARLGPYELVTSLGAGGMGEVYRAHDSRLARDVAIKVIRDTTAGRAGSRERFEREARAVAALSHPNIVGIHDVGTAHGRIYAVMELLEGETLRARLQRGAIPWRKAVEIACAIADGLGAAHARGIVHRDLKPANVFLTTDGRVKVLDFGLATLREPPSADLLSPSAPSDTDADGAPGTPGYMAPEHVVGRATDARSDLFALGCVLHEMVSGQRTFARKTRSDTMAAILNEDAPELVPGVPFELRRLVTRCLEKDREARFQSARDLAFHLRALLDPAASGIASNASSDRRTRQTRVVRLAAGAAAVAALALLGLSFQTVRQPAAAVQSHLLPSQGTAWAGVRGAAFVAAPMAISPDGQQLVFTASEGGGRPSLWIRRLDSLTSQRLEGTEDAGGPFWSPDSRAIGFNAAGQLKTIAAFGGPPQTLSETKMPGPWFSGGAWSPTGDILFGQYARPLLRLTPSGLLVAATDLNRSRGDIHHCCPAFLPDGRHFLYFVSAASAEETGIYLSSLDSNTETFLVRTTGRGVFAPPGHLLFRRGGILMAARFDGRRLPVIGEPTPLTDRAEAFSVSSTGVLVYAQGGRAIQLVWVDRAGNELEELPISGALHHRRLSHDGRRLAATVADPWTGFRDIWVYDLVRHVPTRLTRHPADELSPVWSTDDERIIFTSNRNGRFDVYVKAADGTGEEELLYESQASKGVGSWSRDMRHLIFNTDGEPDGQLWSLSLPERKATRLLVTPFLLWDGQISADGEFVAYMSGQTERSHDVYVQPFPSGPRWQLSRSGGRWPRWRRDGKELFFVEYSTRTLMAVDRTSAGGFDDARPRALFTLPASYDDWYNTQDGERFLFGKLTAQESTEALTLVQNWPALLPK